MLPPLSSPLALELAKYANKGMRKKMGALALRWYKVRRKMEKVHQGRYKLVIGFVTELRERLTVLQLIKRRVF